MQTAAIDQNKSSSSNCNKRMPTVYRTPGTIPLPNPTIPSEEQASILDLVILKEYYQKEQPGRHLSQLQYRATEKTSFFHMERFCIARKCTSENIRGSQFLCPFLNIIQCIILDTVGITPASLVTTKIFAKESRKARFYNQPEMAGKLWRREEWLVRVWNPWTATYLLQPNLCSLQTHANNRIWRILSHHSCFCNVQWCSQCTSHCSSYLVTPSPTSGNCSQCLNNWKSS